MADMTTHLKNELYDHVLRNAAYASPAAVYVALFTTATGDGGTGTEVSGGGYARQAVTFGEPTDGVGDNTGAITFGPATEAWGTVTHCALYDAETGGNMLMHDALAAQKAIGDTDEFEFADGELDAAFA